MKSSPLSTTEFIRICESLWGPKWKCLAGRNLGREEKTIQRYAHGTHPIPTEVEAKLMDIADIGRAGEILKAEFLAFLNRSVPAGERTCDAQKAHAFATKAVRQLTIADLLKDGMSNAP